MTKNGNGGCEISHLYLSFCVLFYFLADNWALIHAQQLAVEEKLPLHICFCLLAPKSKLSTLRHYSFMLKGLEEVAKVLDLIHLIKIVIIIIILTYFVHCTHIMLLQKYASRGHTV